MKDENNLSTLYILIQRIHTHGLAIIPCMQLLIKYDLVVNGTYIKDEKEYPTLDLFTSKMVRIKSILASTVFILAIESLLIHEDVSTIL